MLRTAALYSFLFNQEVVHTLDVTQPFVGAWRGRYCAAHVKDVGREKEYVGLRLWFIDVGQLGTIPRLYQKEDCHTSRIRACLQQGFHEKLGTADNPGPTLNIVPKKRKSCRGIAFKFSDQKRREVLMYLANREGKGFEFPELCIKFCLSSRAKAIVSIYRGTAWGSGADTGQDKRLEL